VESLQLFCRICRRRVSCGSFVVWHHSCRLSGLQRRRVVLSDFLCFSSFWSTRCLAILWDNTSFSDIRRAVSACFMAWLPTRCWLGIRKGVLNGKNYIADNYLNSLLPFLTLWLSEKCRKNLILVGKLFSKNAQFRTENPRCSKNSGAKSKLLALMISSVGNRQLTAEIWSEIWRGASPKIATFFFANCFNPRRRWTTETDVGQWNGRAKQVI